MIVRKLDLTPDDLRLKIPDKYKDDTSSVKSVTEDNQNPGALLFPLPFLPQNSYNSIIFQVVVDKAVQSTVMVNYLISTWVPRIKFIDDLTALEIAPRNSPSYTNHIVSDIQTFACNNNMKLNPEKMRR